MSNMGSTGSGTLRFEGHLALIFALLGVLLTGVITAHWLLVIEPLLRADAASRSHALAQAESRNLERLFINEHADQAGLETELRATLGSILLIKDPATGTPFIRRIDLLLDYDVIDAPPGSLDISAGAAACEACFIAEVPLYHPHSHQLIGLATFHSSPEFLQRLIDNVRIRLLWIGLASLGLIGVAGVGTRHLLHRLEAVEDELRQAALTDSLTGIANRRALFERLTAELERAQRYPDQPCSIILIDLDHFKVINDSFGHAMGDEVLIKVAATLLRVGRKADLVGRYGGEEFLVILPHTDRRGAMNLAERVRIAVKTLTWADPRVRLTVSGGICEAQGETADALIEAADRKLYLAKAAGRDRMED
ncbi:GGDEF domain-containing protein [Lamprocystis purpurea]|uniref:GGDEF domain-containing protein n=1 Tax=Lamprocystis purpurea TaxID=61598 RepID=UPI0009FDDDA6|nr:GGDEF domain-containing protein [Lamprocystis purpurea]